MHTTQRTMALTLAGTALALLQACANPPASPVADRHFGNAVRQAAALQTLNPGAGKDTTAVALHDAQALRNALAKQRDSFKTPPATFNVIGITASSSGQ